MAGAHCPAYSENSRAVGDPISKTSGIAPEASAVDLWLPQCLQWDSSEHKRAAET